MVPTSLLDALALQPPLSDAILRQVIHHLKGNEGRKALQRGLSDSAWSQEVRAAAVGRLRSLDGA
jgi:hypothetical protein